MLWDHLKEEKEEAVAWYIQKCTGGYVLSTQAPLPVTSGFEVVAIKHWKHVQITS